MANIIILILISDQVVATKDPALSSEVLPEDIAIIKNRENVGKIYILDDLDNIKKLILPIRAMVFGYLYGYIAIESDFNTHQV